jgi:hypothetical protein
MAALATTETLDRNILARLRKQAAEGTDLETMVRSTLDDLGYPSDFVVPAFAYFCKAFSLPLIAVLPLREWMETKDDKLVVELWEKIKAEKKTAAVSSNEKQ